MASSIPPATTQSWLASPPKTRTDVKQQLEERLAKLRQQSSTSLSTQNSASLVSGEVEPPPRLRRARGGLAEIAPSRLSFSYAQEEQKEESEDFEDDEEEPTSQEESLLEREDEENSEESEGLEGSEESESEESNNSEYISESQESVDDEQYAEEYELYEEDPERGKSSTVTPIN